MSKLIVLEVKIVDEDTGAIDKHVVEVIDEEYGYHVHDVFSELGLKIAREVDPNFQSPT